VQRKEYITIGIIGLLMLTSGMILGILLGQTGNNINQTNYQKIEYENTLLKRNTLDCFWALQFSENYEDAYNHFGEDYKKEYKYDCENNTIKNWEIIK